MNTTTLKGDGQAIGGQIKETVGDVTGNSSLQGEGVVDQITGNANKAQANIARLRARPVATPRLSRCDEYQPPAIAPRSARM